MSLLKVWFLPLRGWKTGPRLWTQAMPIKSEVRTQVKTGLGWQTRLGNMGVLGALVHLCWALSLRSDIKLSWGNCVRSQEDKGSMLVMETGNKHAERSKNMAAVGWSSPPAVPVSPDICLKFLPSGPMACSISFWQIPFFVGSSWASLIAERKQEKKSEDGNRKVMELGFSFLHTTSEMREHSVNRWFSDFSALLFILFL